MRACSTDERERERDRERKRERDRDRDRDRDRETEREVSEDCDGEHTHTHTRTPRLNRYCANHPPDTGPYRTKGLGVRQGGQVKKGGVEEGVRIRAWSAQDGQEVVTLEWNHARERRRMRHVSCCLRPTTKQTNAHRYLCMQTRVAEAHHTAGTCARRRGGSSRQRKKSHSGKSTDLGRG